MDTRLIKTLHFYRQFALSLGKENPSFLQNYKVPVLLINIMSESVVSSSWGRFLLAPP